MINLFSLVLIALYLYFIFYAIIKRKSCLFIFYAFFVINLLLELFVGVGYFIKIGSTELLYSEFSLLVLFISSSYVLFTKKITPKELFLLMLFIVSCLLSFVLPILIPYGIKILSFEDTWEAVCYNDNFSFKEISFSVRSLLMLFRVIIFCVVFSFGKNKIFNSKTINFTLSIISKFTWFYLGLFVFELLLKYFLNASLYPIIINRIFGIGEASYETILYRSGLPAFQALFKEPSHVAMNLFVVSIAILANYYNEKKRNFYIKIIGLNMYSLFTISMSAILFVGFFIIIFFRFGRFKLKMSSVYAIIVFAFLSIVTVYSIPYFRTRIDSVFYVIDLVINDNLKRSMFSTTSGEVPRIASILYCLKWSILFPLFGVGLGNTYSHAFIPSMLVNIGFVGVVCWFFYLKEVKKIKQYDVVTVLCLIAIYSFQGLLGYFYTISFVYIFIVYFDKSIERNRIRYARNCNSQLQW